MAPTPLIVERTYPALPGTHWLCRVCRVHVDPTTHIPDADECRALIQERIFKNIEE